MLTFTFLACKSPTEEAPDDVLTTLMEGNQRFSGQSDENDQNTKKLIQELSENGQQPDAIIISCSDSRVAPELIFDQTLGKLFVIRTAGNIIGDYELGSIEYAVQSFNTPLIVVMGHSKCGAIDAFLQHRQDHVEGHIQDIIDYIKNEPEELAIEKEGVLDMDHAIHANVLHGINVLKHDQPIISERYEKGELRIVGAIYHIEDGRVEIIR